MPRLEPLLANDRPSTLTFAFGTTNLRLRWLPFDPKLMDADASETLAAPVKNATGAELELPPEELQAGLKPGALQGSFGSDELVVSGA